MDRRYGRGAAKNPYGRGGATDRAAPRKPRARAADMKSMDDAISSVLSAQNAGLSDQVGYTVLRKAMDSQKEEGAAIVQMIKQAGEVGQEGSRGGVTGAQGLDLYA